MLINVKLCQCTDINFKLILICQCFCQLWIQAVNAFNNQNIVFSKFQWTSYKFFMSLHKIKIWNYHFFSIQQFLHLFLKQINIHCTKSFKIIISLLVFRSLSSFFKVIIYCDRMGTHSICTKLYRQSV